MKNSILFFLFLIPAFLFAQYPNTGNKARLGYQTTGDGLIWRGVAADTVLKPRVIAHAYFQLDTVNGVLRRYIATRGSWQVVGGGGSDTDSTVYATRYWTSQNFFPLEGGTLTGTGGAGFIGFPSQVSAPGTPVSGLNVYAQGSSFNWKGTDGHERQFGGTLTGGRSYTLPDINGTLALGTGTTDRSARWSGSNTLAAGNITDNGTKLEALKPWQFQSWTTAGRPTGVTGYTGYNTTGNGIEWYQGSRWAYGLESTFARGTATYIPYFDANGQITQSSALRWNQSISEFFVNGSFNIANLQAISAANIHNVGGLRFSQNANPGGVGFRNDIGSGNWYFAGNGNAVNTGTFIWEVVNNGSMGPSNNGKFFQYRGKFNSGNGPSAGATWKYMSIEPEYNFTTTNAFTIYGWDYGPVLTGLTSANVTHNAVRVQTGNVLLNTISGKTGIGTAFTPGEELDINGDTRVRDSLRVSTLPNQTSATKVLTADASGWIGYRDFSSFENIYNTNGTFGAGRIGTLTDSLRFRFSGNDVFRLKSNGVLHVTMPTEASSFVITNTPNENYNNYRGQVFLTGTTSAGDTATGTRRNNHEASFFSGINLVEGGNNVYYDAVSGYGNVVRGDQPKNVVYGTYNTINLGSDNGAYGFGINITGSRVTVFGRETTVVGSDIITIGRGNTITQSNAFIYGSNISSGTNLTQHGFGTVAPAARVHVKSLSGAPTILADGGTVVFNAYGTSATTAATLGKTESGYLASFATDGTVLSRTVASVQDGNGIYGGSGTLSGNTTVDADGNSFDIENLPQMTLGGTGWEIYSDDFETDIYNAEYTEILAGTGAGATFDNATETTTLRGQVNALRESYYEITSTLSPQTFSSSISDNYVNQGGTQASFTFLFPATPADGQILMITWGNAISVVTLDGNGNTITGTAVTTAVAGTRRMFKYYDSSGEWVKIY